MPETCKISGISRRTVLFAAAGAAPFVTLMGGEAQAKVSQKTVQYQATPKDGHQCDGCAQFVAPKACKVVDGDIAPTGWCALWVKKPA